MELIGGIESIRQAFAPMPAAESLECLQLPSGNWQVSVAAGAQDELDLLIDRLRQNQIGICRLERTQLTLEEIFLSAVQL
jgi:hypothetical protein